MCSTPNVNAATNSVRRAKRQRLHSLQINTVEHLASQLGLSPETLQRFAANPKKAFRPGTFTDKKGKRRPKAEPAGILKPALKKLNRMLQRLDLPIAIQGGRHGYSNITNASEHVGKEVVLKFDIRDFFPSISTQRVFDAFNKRCECCPEVAGILAKLTTFNNQLAQGSPPSTIIAALVAERLLLRILKLVRPFAGNVTLYVDDLTISGPAHLAYLKSKILEIIRQEGFEPHPTKSQILGNGDEQLVTGVHVNNNPDVSTIQLNEAKNMIKAIEDKIKIGSRPTEVEIVAIDARLRYIARLNPGAAKFQRRRLRKLQSSSTI